MSDGWEVSASTSEEVKDTPTASGRGGIVGLVVLDRSCLVACMYRVLAPWVRCRALPTTKPTRWPTWARCSAARGGASRSCVTVLLSTLSTLWTTILYLSRSVYAMGRDGVLPRALGRAGRARRAALVAGRGRGAGRRSASWSPAFPRAPPTNSTLVLNASSVFLGLLFVLRRSRRRKRFLGRAAVHARGVLVPLAGALALLGVLVATVAVEDRTTSQGYACAGVAVGYTICALARPDDAGRASGRKGNGSGRPKQTAPASSPGAKTMSLRGRWVYP